jgi:hypothetical protein
LYHLRLGCIVTTITKYLHERMKETEVAIEEAAPEDGIPFV